MICRRKKSQSRHTRVNSACPRFPYNTSLRNDIFSLYADDNELNCARLDLDGNICLPENLRLFFQLEKICITEDNCRGRGSKVHNAPFRGGKVHARINLLCGSILLFIAMEVQYVYLYMAGKNCELFIDDFPCSNWIIRYLSGRFASSGFQ